MDFGSYKTIRDNTLQQINKSEHKREELNNKLQAMYQDKLECEKSIMRTMEIQQKQFMEEKRRRTERNENILRTLERIDYQAQLLAAKTDRLRALKKQYERYLLSLWATQRVTISPNLSASAPRLYTSPYKELPIHQSSYDEATAHSYQNNQSWYREAPLPSSVEMSAVENSINSGNYRGRSSTPTTGAALVSTYPFGEHKARYEYAPQMPLLYPPQTRDDNASDKKSFRSSNDSAINIGELNVPTTINSIYSQHQLAPQFALDEKSSTSFLLSYQKPLESHLRLSATQSNNNVKTSRALPRENPLITSDGVAPQSSRQFASSEPFNRLKSDCDERSIYRRERLQSDTDSEGDQVTMNTSGTKVTRQPDLPLSTRRQSNDKESHEQKHSLLGVVVNSPSTINNFGAEANDSFDERMHQVWKRAAPDESVESAEASTFVIPKIIVDTQIDVSEVASSVGGRESVRCESDSGEEGVEKQDRDIPEKLLSQTSSEVLKHSSDNRPNGSSSGAHHLSMVDGRAEGEATVYHRNDDDDGSNKGALASASTDEHQQHKQPQPHSSVEYELRDFDKIEISSSSHNLTDESVGIARPATVTSASPINNINDDKNQKISQASPSPPPSSAGLNDKISEIYRKIEKIEGEYYGEKGKIMENFDRKLSASSSPGDEAKLDDDANAEISPSTQHRELDQSADITTGNDVPEQQSEQQQQQQQQQFYFDGNQENLIYENQQNEMTADDSFGGNFEMQQQQPQMEVAQSYYSEQGVYEEGALESEENLNVQGEVEATELHYSYEPSPATIEYENNYTLGYEQPLEFSNENNELSLQQQQQQEELPSEQPTFVSDANFAQQPESALNESSDAVYYNYDPSTQQSFYDDANYAHHEAAVAGAEDSQSNEYFYQHDTVAGTESTLYRQDHSNESNYNDTADTEQDFNETTSNEIEMNPSYDNEPFAADGTHTDSQMPLENANFESREPQIGYEQQAAPLSEESYDETSSSSMLQQPNAPALIEEKESAVTVSTKLEDVKLVNQLLDSESDDTASRSNLLQTAIKEEGDESDFDFSAN